MQDHAVLPAGFKGLVLCRDNLSPKPLNPKSMMSNKFVRNSALNIPTSPDPLYYNLRPVVRNEGVEKNLNMFVYIYT